jgi:hypothetical protein
MTRTVIRFARKCSSSLRKNSKVWGFSVARGIGIALILVFSSRIEDFRAVFAESGLCRNEPRNADQVIGDEIEYEIGANPKNAAMLGLAHCAICLPQPKMHQIILRRVCDMP